MASPSRGVPSPAAVPNDYGTVDLYLGPEAPEGKASNWIRTMPNKSWQLGEVELLS